MATGGSGSGAGPLDRDDVFEHGSARWADTAEIEAPEARLLEPAGIPLGYEVRQPDLGKSEWYPKKFRKLHHGGDGHILLIAPSGSGKNRDFITPLLAECTHSALVIDPKGQSAAMTARRRRELGQVRFLNPFGWLDRELRDRGAKDEEFVSFNPLEGLDRSSPELIDDVSAITEAIVYVEGKEPFFDQSAQQLWTGLTLSLLALAEEDEAVTLCDVRDLLTKHAILAPVPDHVRERNPQLTSWEYMIQSRIKLHRAKGGRGLHGLAIDQLSAFEDLNRTTQSVIMAAAAQTRFLASPPIRDALAGSDVDFGDLKRERLTIFLILPFERMRTHARWLRLMVRCALNAMQRIPGPSRYGCLFLLDEFANLRRMDGIEDAMQMMRGSGICMLPVLQDIHQLRRLYGDTGWQTFVSAATTRIFFRARDRETSEYISNLLGDTTLHVIQRNLQRQTQQGSGQGYQPQGWLGMRMTGSDHRGTSASLSAAEHLIKRPLLTPDEVRSLAPDAGLLFHEGLARPLMIGRIPWYHQPELKALIDPDPEHTTR